MSLKKNINIKKAIVFAFTLLLPPGLIFAQPTFTTTNIPNVNIDQVLTNIGNYFFGFVIVACIFVILWAAFNMVTAGDDEAKITKSRTMLLWAFVGMVLAASARAIVGVVQSILGM